MFLQTWKLWQKITTGIVSTAAAVASVYGFTVWVDNYVFDEAEAGEMAMEQLQVQKSQSKTILAESYNREAGDLELQMDLVDVRLGFYYSEAEYRELDRREDNLVESLEREKVVLGRRLHYLACLQDPTRVDKSTCTQ